MTTKHQVLFQGHLIALAFLRDDAPGVDGWLGGLIPFERTGGWSHGDSAHFKGSGLHRQTFPVGTSEKEMLEAVLADAVVEPWKCVSYQYQ